MAAGFEASRHAGVDARRGECPVGGDEGHCGAVVTRFRAADLEALGSGDYHVGREVAARYGEALRV